jgi:hypothetical protein
VEPDNPLSVGEVEIEVEDAVKKVVEDESPLLSSWAVPAVSAKHR